MHFLEIYLNARVNKACVKLNLTLSVHNYKSLKPTVIQVLYFKYSTLIVASLKYDVKLP